MGMWRAAGLKVGVLAVDPSSPSREAQFSGIAFGMPSILTPSSPLCARWESRGSLGGLSASAYLMLRAFDLVGFDLVIIETVGVGQTELEIVNVADDVAVVLVPESGDSVSSHESRTS